MAFRAKIPLRTGLNPQMQRWMQDFAEQASGPTHELSHTFGASANVEERIRHKIGRRPAGFRVIDQLAAGSVYTSKPADRFHLYLKSSVAGLTVRLEVF